MKAPRRWLYAGLTLLLLVIAVTGGVLWWAVATEPGARWVVAEALRRAPVDVRAEGISGTLWRGVRAANVMYSDSSRRVEVVGLELAIDWSTTAMEQVGITRLAATHIEVTSIGDPDPDPEPLQLETPLLPVRVLAGVISVGSVEADGASVGAIDVRTVDVDGHRVDVGAFSWALADASWWGTGRLHGSLDSLAFEHDLRGAYPLRSAGTLDLLSPGAPVFDVQASFEEWRLESWVAGDAKLQVSGTLADYRARLDLEISDGERISAQVRGDLGGNREALTDVDLIVEALEGSARLVGNARWTPGLAAEFVIVGEGINLASLTGGFATRLDWDVQLEVTGAESYSLDLRRISGSYDEQPVLATGTASRDGDVWRCRSCDAAVGDNHLQFDLALRNRRLDGTIDIDAPALDQLHPEVEGAVRAAGRLSGRIDLPVLSGDLRASAVTVRDWSIDELAIVTRSATTENVDVDIDVLGLNRENLPLGGGQIRVRGRFDELDIESDWAAQGVRVEYAASLGQEEDTVSGRVLRAGIDHVDTGLWALTEPVDFRLTPDGLEVAVATLANGETRLDIGRVVTSADSVSASAVLTAAPLRWLDSKTPPEVTFSGWADADMALQQIDGNWNGRMKWRQRNTVLHIDSGDGDRFEMSVPVAEAEADLGVSGASIRARIEADGDTRAALDASVSALSADGILDAELSAGGREWDWVSAFIPEIEEVVGAVEARFTARGRLNKPEIVGELRLSEGGVVLPAFNVPVSDINARVSGGSSGALTVQGEATAGTGKLAITGTIVDPVSTTPRVSLEVRGEDATVLDWPDYALVASPDMSLAGSGNRYRVGGRVRLERAEIEVRELPEGAVRPSDDVYVAGRKAAERQAAQLTGEFDIELAEAVHVRAFGLDTNLEGMLRISLPESQDPRANGEVALVGGFFEMYGQRLEIERGTMLFSGALDNPFVDVRVARTIDGSEGAVVVGLDITGRAEALSSTLFSDPAMSEAEVLSYLVTGRPLNQAGSVDGQLMSDAAFALGLRQAAGITNQIGQSVGLDELTLEGANQEAAELVAGKQISSKLFARYRYGVFSSIGELLLKYSLTESLSVELGTGEFEWIDIQYTIERD